MRVVHFMHFILLCLLCILYGFPTGICLVLRPGDSREFTAPAQCVCVRDASRKSPKRARRFLLQQLELETTKRSWNASTHFMQLQQNATHIPFVASVTQNVLTSPNPLSLPSLPLPCLDLGLPGSRRRLSSAWLRASSKFCRRAASRLRLRRSAPSTAHLREGQGRPFTCKRTG